MNIRNQSLISFTLPAIQQKCKLFIRAPKWIFALLLACLFTPAAFTHGAGDYFLNNVWTGFTKIANQAADLAVGDNPTHKTAIEYITFREPKYIRLLNEAQEILGESEFRDLFLKIEDLRLQTGRNQDRIVALKKERPGAPDDSLNPLKTTRKSIDKKIAELNAENTAMDSRIAALKDNLLAALAAKGIKISAGELDYLFISAEGDELFRLMNLAENMKNIQNTIAVELAAEPGNMELAKSYAGIYLVSLEAYAHAHDTSVGRIGEYRKSLEKIIIEAQHNHAESRELLRKASDEEQASLKANLGISERTLDVARTYDSILTKRIAAITDSRRRLDHKIRIARNTFRTIMNGSSLISLVNNGENDYFLLSGFELPELNVIYDRALMAEFDQIAGRIKKAD